MTEKLTKLEKQLIQSASTRAISTSLIVNRIADFATTGKAARLVHLNIAVPFVFRRNSTWRVDGVSAFDSSVATNQKRVSPPGIGINGVIACARNAAKSEDTIRVERLDRWRKNDSKSRNCDSRSIGGENVFLHVRNGGFHETDERLPDLRRSIDL